MSARLLSCVTQRDLPGLLLLLAHCTKDQINAPPTALGPALSPLAGPRHNRPALHAACQLGDVVMTQLLVWVSLSPTPTPPPGRFPTSPGSPTVCGFPAACGFQNRLRLHSF